MNDKSAEPPAHTARYASQATRCRWRNGLLHSGLLLALLTALAVILLPYGIGLLVWHDLTVLGNQPFCLRDVDIDLWRGRVGLTGLTAGSCSSQQPSRLQLDRLELWLSWPAMTQPLHVQRLVIEGGAVEINHHSDGTMLLGGLPWPPPVDNRYTSLWLPRLVTWLTGYSLQQLTTRQLLIEQIEGHHLALWVTRPELHAAVAVHQAQLGPVTAWQQGQHPLQFDFDGTLDGAALQLSATMATPLEAYPDITFDVQVKSLPLFPWLPLLPLAETQELEGRLSASGRGRFRTTGPGQWQGQYSGQLTLTDLQLQARGLRVDMPQLSWKGRIDHQPRQLMVQGYLDNSALDIEWIGHGVRLRHNGAKLAVNLAMTPDDNHEGGGWWMVQQQQRLRLHQLKLRWPRGRFNEKMMAWNGSMLWRLAPDQLWPRNWRSQGRLKIDGLDIEAMPAPPQSAPQLAPQAAAILPQASLGIASLSSSIDSNATLTEQAAVTVTQKGPTTLLWLHAVHDGSDWVERFLSWNGQWRLNWQPALTRLPYMAAGGQLEGKHLTLKLERGNWVVRHRGLEWHGRATFNPEEGHGELATAGRCSINGFGIDVPRKRLTLVDMDQSDWLAFYTSANRRFDVGHLRARQVSIGSSGNGDNPAAALVQQEQLTVEELRFITTPSRKLSFKSIQTQTQAQTRAQSHSSHSGQRIRLQPVWELLASVGVAVPGSGVAVKPPLSMATTTTVVPSTLTTAQPPVPSAPTVYAIVMEAFRRQDEATAAAARQRQSGQSVWLRSRIDGRGQSWHSLAVGSYSSPEQAQQQLNLLKKNKKNSGAYIVVIDPAANYRPVP
ncbi:MAG: SPOR domain-containing protein [Magnetococcales bacterium]|nr:SPOR domain-containing protein [Magnetococcales bacterium]